MEVYLTMGEGKKVFLEVLIAIILVLFEILIGTLLWNWIAVAAFGLPTLTAWEFTGIKLLIWILMPGRASRGDE